MSYITAIGIANPAHQIKQSVIADFMVRAMGADDSEARRLQALFKITGIDTRYSVLHDYARSNQFDFYSNQKDMEPFPSTKERLELYRQHAAGLSCQAIENCLLKVEALAASEITHLVVVSCTGMYAPGLDIDIVKRLGLSTSIERTCINFMGCYASFNGMKLAHSFCEQNSKAKVLMVCTELCSIHFQKDKSDDNFLANALFADGSAAVLMEASPRKGLNLRPTSFFCDLAPEGERDMAWTVGDFGFEMKLTSYVPEIIRNGIKKLTESLLAKIQHSISDIDYFAIHPGGRKILEVIEQELMLTKESNHDAYEVLRNFGNMSSPTVLFVLHELCRKINSTDDKKQILSFAFGPGLTLESMLLKIEFA